MSEMTDPALLRRGADPRQTDDAPLDTWEALVPRGTKAAPHVHVWSKPDLIGVRECVVVRCDIWRRFAADQ